jgi:hypothetical protein
MRPSDYIFIRVKAQVFLEDSLNTTLVNCDFKWEAGRYINVWCEARTFNALLNLFAVTVCGRSELRWVPKRNLFHMAAFPDNLFGYSKALEHLESSGL